MLLRLRPDFTLTWMAENSAVTGELAERLREALRKARIGPTCDNLASKGMVKHRQALRCYRNGVAHRGNKSEIRALRQMPVIPDPAKRHGFTQQASCRHRQFRPDSRRIAAGQNNRRCHGVSMIASDRNSSR